MLTDKSRIFEDGVEFLRLEFVKRNKRNRMYSLRSFAKNLKISSGRLSEILSGKRKIGRLTGEKIADALALPPDERELFLKSLKTERTTQLKLPASKAKYIELKMDSYHFIADWYHYAILSLMDTDDFSSDVRDIAARLGITVVEARSAIERLLRLGIIEQNDAQLKCTMKNTATTTDVSSAALRMSHKQILNHAIEALEEIPIELRDLTSISIAMDPAKMDVAKKHIKKFRLDMAELLETGPKTEVYNLNIQLVPVTKRNL